MREKGYRSSWSSMPRSAWERTGGDALRRASSTRSVGKGFPRGAWEPEPQPPAPKGASELEFHPSSLIPNLSSSSVATCPKFLSLLGGFYEAADEPLPLDAVLIDPADMPEPYHELLVHRNDMTPTLERYHGERVELRVLQHRAIDNQFFRHIVLEGSVSQRPLEYGAIRIALGSLEEPARRQVLECRTPLGRILGSLGIVHQACPGGFFKIRSNALIARVLQLAGRPWLFGRCNCLAGAAGETIAEVIEIMPILSGDEANP